MTKTSCRRKSNAATRRSAGGGTRIGALELGTLTGGLAHEIKNPLSTVLLNLQLLQEDLSPDNPAYGRIVNRLNLVQRETARLRDILDDFLRYAGKLELCREPVDLNLLVEELVDFFTPQAQVHKVQARWKPSWRLPGLGSWNIWSRVGRRMNVLFTDRQDAGRQLAERLLALKEKNPVVLALPRGGVPVGRLPVTWP